MTTPEDLLADMVLPSPGAPTASFDTGTVTSIVDPTHALVDLGDKQVTTFVPPSLGGTIAVDSAVRVSVQENTHVLDSVLAGATAGTVPVGSVVMWATAAPPDGWLELNGGTYSSATYPALFSVLGTTTLPDMRDRAPVGASATKAEKTTGGAASVTQTVAQMPVHGHGMSHTHDISHTHDHAHTHTMAHTHSHIHDHGMGHTHTVYGYSGFDNNDHSGNSGRLAASDKPYDGGNAYDPTTSTSSTGATQANTAAPNTGGSSAASTGGASTSTTGGASNSTSGASNTSNTSNAGSGASMSILNPYLALNFIIKAR